MSELVKSSLSSITNWRKLTFKDLKTEILSGLTVALALVPEAVAFAFIAGVEPLVGLYAAFLVGLITSIFGGRPGMISGATGALAVVMVALVKDHGVEYLFAAVVLMGIFQVLAGLLRLGKFIRLVPYPVMLGFVNGLAIVIFLAQLDQFKIPDTHNWLPFESLFNMGSIVGLTMIVIFIIPKITKIIPAPLAGILFSSLVVILFSIDTKTVGDLADISGSLPQYHFPAVPLNLETLKIILPYSLILAAIGLIESLLTLTLIDELTDTRGRNSQECVAQGGANIVTGLFGGMGGCAMIGQSMINIKSGARRRISGVAASLFLLCFILFASDLIKQIPVAALIGVMFVVVIHTFEWSSFRVLKKIPRHDAFVLILVSLVTVFTDLAIAVITGVIVSALVFAWKQAHDISVVIEQENENSKEYKLSGQLFFGSITKFKELFDPNNDPKHVTIDFMNSRVWDHSALEAIDSIADKYQKLGKQLHLKHLSNDCQDLLYKAGAMVETDDDDPVYRVVVDYKQRPPKKTKQAKSSKLAKSEK